MGFHWAGNPRPGFKLFRISKGHSNAGRVFGRDAVIRGEHRGRGVYPKSGDGKCRKGTQRAQKKGIDSATRCFRHSPIGWAEHSFQNSRFALFAFFCGHPSPFPGLFQPGTVPAFHILPRNLPAFVRRLAEKNLESETLRWGAPRRPVHLLRRPRHGRQTVSPGLVPKLRLGTHLGGQLCCPWRGCPRARPRTLPPADTPSTRNRVSLASAFPNGVWERGRFVVQVAVSSVTPTRKRGCRFHAASDDRRQFRRRDQ